MDIRIKEVINNLKNYDFDILGNYKMDGAEAKKLIEAIEETDKKIADYTYTIGLLQDRLEAVNKWIPVSERMPDENGRYLVTVKQGYITFGTWVDVAENWEQVTAWMPLPEPYKRESEE